MFNRYRKKQLGLDRKIILKKLLFFEGYFSNTFLKHTHAAHQRIRSNLVRSSKKGFLCKVGSK